jgi:hypothetical protein
MCERIAFWLLGRPLYRLPKPLCEVVTYWSLRQLPVTLFRRWRAIGNANNR